VAWRRPSGYRTRIDGTARVSLVPADGASWPSGLTDAEAADRRARGEGNTVTVSGSVPLTRILRRNVLTILNGTLFSVSLVLLALGLVGDAFVTAGPVAMNVVVSVAQEIRAKRKLDRLTLITRPGATVQRAGRERAAAPEELVRGDIVILRRGDQAVVDGRVVAGRVELDESVLTGEAEAVSRGEGEPILSGSACVAGSAAMEVTLVGGETFASRLANEARRGSDERTPLRRDLDTLILAIGVLTVIAAVPVGLSVLRAGETLFSTKAIQAAAVLVALVPQGLAVMATVTYTVAALRVSRAGAVVQRLDAVESMSRVDTLCLDKTGTLTTQKLVFEMLIPVGDDPGGVRELLALAAASATARNRTLDALATALPAKALAPLAEVPFSSDRRWSAVTLPGLPPRTLLLGSAEVLAGHDPVQPAIEAEVTRLTHAGRRVLLLAEATSGELHDGPVPRLPDCRVLGIVVLQEEVRPDAADTLARLQEAGLDLKLISGDHPATVAALAASVGIATGSTLSGPEIEGMDDTELAAVVGDVSVFGRIQPEDKRRLVNALRAGKRYVAMTGDGVNDVLALRRAHLGIAMQSGSPAARAVAGLVLLGDRFQVLPRAVVEGQRVVAAMMAVSSVLLARTVYMLLIVVAAALLDLPFPFTPKNNAVLALVTVGIPTLVLVVWVRPIRAPESVIRRVLQYAIPSGIAVALLALPILVLAFSETTTEMARSIITTQTVFSGIALIPVLFPAEARRHGPLGAGGDPRPTLLAITMLAVYAGIEAVPFARDFFELRVLPIDIVVRLFLYTLAWMLLLIAAQQARLGQRALTLLAGRRRA
jgi:cation-transporting P-type ATPase E